MRYCVLAPALLLAGCMMSATPWNQQISLSYDHEEATEMMGPGTGSIHGLVIFAWHHRLITCHGTGVTLLPATPYAKQWFPYHLGGWGEARRSSDLKAMRPVAKEFLQLARTADCDEDGHFRFDGLREGDYILHVSTQREQSAEDQGTTYYSMVHVNQGRTTEVVFSTGPNSPQSTLRYGKPIW